MLKSGLAYLNRSANESSNESLTSEALPRTHDPKFGQVKQRGNCDASCEINCDDDKMIICVLLTV